MVKKKDVFSIFILLFLFLIVGAGILYSVSPVQAASDDDYWTDGPGDANDSFSSDGSGQLYGVSSYPYWSLWSYDNDIKRDAPSSSSSSEIESPDYSSNPTEGDITVPEYSDPGASAPMVDEGMNISELNGYFGTIDATYSVPPNTTEQWNEQSLEALNGFLGNAYNVKYPKGVVKTDDGGGHMGPGYVGIYGVTPSTKLHYSGEANLTYVSQNGTVLTYSDFMVDNMETEYSDEDDHTDGVMYTYSFEDMNVKWVQLATDSSCNINTSCQIAKTNGGQYANQVEYENLDEHIEPGSIDKIYVRQKIETKVEEQRYTYDECSKNEDDCGWQEAGESTEVDTQIVTADMQIALQNLQPNVSVGKYKANTLQHFVYHVSSTDSYSVANYWGSAELGGHAIVRSNWKYYTSRDTSWNNMFVKKTTDGTSTVHTKFYPAQLHAYPSDSATELFNSGWSKPVSAKVTHVDGMKRDGPKEPPKNLRVDWANISSDGLYTPTREVTVDVTDRTGGSSGAVTINGIVPGTQKVVHPENYSTVQIHNAQMRIKIREIINDTHIRISAGLVDTETSPKRYVDTKSRPSYLTVNGKKYETDGKLLTVIEVDPTQKVLTAKYHSASFHKVAGNKSISYRDSTVRTIFYRDGIAGLISLFHTLLIISALLLLPIWLLHMGTLAFGWDLWDDVWEYLKDNNPFE